MKKIFFVFSLVFAAFLYAAPQKIERFLLVAGANDGGKDRVRLRYAESDANSFANVLHQMGGVYQSNILRVHNPSAASMRNGFSELEKRLQSKEPGTRKEVFVYYSGHADDKGLRLGSDVYSWADFRKNVNNINADVKVAVIDACGSGAITRTKGGVSRPAFLQDASSEMKGYAFLTSSNENEASQESDRLKGSFFTHALVSGLRGAADMSGNGKVTLNEAYQYAFNETLQSTQNTSAGSQHPSRDMNLAGTGDVVMTDLRETGATLTLDSDLEGKFFIRDDKGNLFAELRKIRGRPIELGMPSGKYSVQMEAPSKIWMANEIQIADGKKTTLSMKDMKSIDREVAVARGDADSVMTGLDSARAASFKVNPFGYSNQPENGVQLGFLTFASRAFVGTQVSLLGNFATDDMAGTQFAWLGNHAFGNFYGVQASGLYNVAKNFDGVQVAPFNIAMNGRGVQGAAINVYADSLNGFQGAAINIARKTTIGQGGAINVAWDAGKLQGGAINIAGSTEYAQGGAINVAGNAGMLQGGVINITGSTEYGQGGAINIAGNAGMFQGGVINIAGSLKSYNTKDSSAGELLSHVTGIQGGVINIGGRVGRQVGVINISGKSDKSPIGLINIVGNGIIDGTFFADETGSMGLTLHMGTPYLYTLVEYGMPLFAKENKSGDWPNFWGIGLGTRFGSWGNFFSLDYSNLNAHSDKWKAFTRGEESNFLHKIRFGGTYKLLPGLGLSSGITMNALTEGWNDNPLHIEPRGGYHWDFTLGDHNVRMWPGLYAGLTVGKF